MFNKNTESLFSASGFRFLFASSNPDTITLSSDIDKIGIELGTTDLIRRRWLDNNFYVFNTAFNYVSSKLNMNFSSYYSSYSGDHFGEVIWARQIGVNNSIRDEYYRGNGKKTEWSLFAKSSYLINDALEIFGDLQFRQLSYKTTGLTSDLVNMLIDQTYNFFNPKFGFSYTFNPNEMFYFSYSRANREPSRSDYESNPNIKAEQLNDFELGWRYRKDGIKLNLNSYYMLYNEQLVLTGALDDVGTPIRANSGSSYRFGLEVDAKIKLSNFLFMRVLVLGQYHFS